MSDHSTENTEIAQKASFDKIRYAQCWEDADILIEALNIQEGDACLGIASAGENCFAMLTRNPEKVIAVDMNPSQLACLELKVSAYRNLDHEGLLQLIGSRPCDNRQAMYEKCKNELTENCRRFWDANLNDIDLGIGSAGKFENYFSLFRNRVIPLIHSQHRIQGLLKGGDSESCKQFYDSTWNNLRWRLLFKIFFSRFMMGRLGRDPAFFQYVEGSVADKILSRTRHALRELNPAENPYLHWIMTGTHGETLPMALRKENFDVIRNNLDRLQWKLGTIESVLEESGENSLDRFNLSDMFEYMSEEAFNEVMKKILRTARPGGRLAYWNMLVSRRASKIFSDKLKDLDPLGKDLLLKDKAFFYSAFIVEEVL